MKKSYLITVLALTLILLFGYQNCAKVSFMTEEGAFFKANTEPFVTDINDDGIVDSIPNNEIPPIVTAPPEDVPPTEEPPVAEPPTSEPPVSEPPVTDTTPIVQPPSTEPPTAEPPVVTNPPTAPPVVQPPVTIEYPVPSPEITGQCDQLNKSFEKKAVHLAAGSNVTDKNGNFLAKAPSLGTLSNINGNLRLLATSADAKIAKLENINGNIILCGFDVLSLVNVKGNIVIIGGDYLGDVNDLTGGGNIKIFP